MISEKKIQKYQSFYKDFLKNNVLKFWKKSDLIDHEYGGFITSIDRQGKKYNDDKSVWFQGRCLYTFSKLCNTYGIKDEWLKAAKSGADFIRNHCIDKDGRMFFILTIDGKPIRKRRYFYSESFIVLGFCEYSLLTKKDEDKEFCEHYFDLMYQIYKDPSSDPYHTLPKENPEVRNLHSNSYPMVLVSAAQTLLKLTGNKEKYCPIIESIIKDVLELHYKEDLHAVLENVNLDGSIFNQPAGRLINPGHCIESSWFLMNYASQTKNNELLEKALNILNWSIERGWDKQYGGLYYFVDLYNRPLEQLEHDMKLWWSHCEAIIASLTAYKLTKDDKYFHLFEKIHKYAFSHFVDDKYGEWYGYLHRDGSVAMEQKGSFWKGPFHLPRCLILSDLIFKSILSDKDLPNLL